MTRVRTKILAATLGVGGAFAAGELVVRLVLPNGNKALEPHPMARWAHTDAFAAYRAHGEGYTFHKSVHPDGFFSTPDSVTTDKPDDVTRIVFLGGSSTACTAPPLPDEQTWPWIVADQLGERAKVDFINAAMPGYSTFESYGRLWARLRAYAPDVVVVYHGWNEMYYFRDTAERVRRWRVQESGQWSFAPEMRPVHLTEHHPIDDWLLGSELLLRLRRALVPPSQLGERGPADVHGELATSFDPEGPEVFRTNLRLMRTAQDVLGFDLYVCKQATLCVPGLSDAQIERCGYRFHGFDHEAHVRAFDAIYRVIDDEIDATRILDTRPLSGTPELFADHIHPTVLGAQRIAEVIASSLGDRLWGPAEPAAPQSRSR